MVTSCFSAWIHFLQTARWRTQSRRGRGNFLGKLSFVNKCWAANLTGNKPQLGRGPLMMSFPSPPPGIQRNLIENKNAKKLKRGSLKAQIFASNSIRIPIKTP